MRAVSNHGPLRDCDRRILRDARLRSASHQRVHARLRRAMGAAPQDEAEREIIPDTMTSAPDQNAKATRRPRP